MPDADSGWQPDPYGRHEERFFTPLGPSQLVRDRGLESYDDPEEEDVDDRSRPILGTPITETPVPEARTRQSGLAIPTPSAAANGHPDDGSDRSDGSNRLIAWYRLEVPRVPRDAGSPHRHPDQPQNPEDDEVSWDEPEHSEDDEAAWDEPRDDRWHRRVAAAVLLVVLAFLLVLGLHVVGSPSGNPPTRDATVSTTSVPGRTARPPAATGGPGPVVTQPVDTQPANTQPVPTTPPAPPPLVINDALNQGALVLRGAGFTYTPVPDPHGPSCGSSSPTIIAESGYTQSFPRVSDLGGNRIVTLRYNCHP